MKRTHGTSTAMLLVLLLLLALSVTTLSREKQSADQWDDACQQVEWTCVNNPRCSDSLGHNALVNVLNEPCGLQGYCIVPNSVCENSRCRCQHGFYQECNTCLPGSRLHEICLEFAQCWAYTAHSKCHQGKCVCEEDYFVYRESFCRKGSAPGDPCSSSEDCLDFGVNSICSVGRCACVPGFSLDTATHRCRTGALGDDCISTIDCTHYIPNSECHNGTCRCEEGYEGKGSASCQPGVPLDEFCTSDEQCQLHTSHATCVDETCQCDRHHQRYGNVCITGVPLQELCFDGDECKTYDPFSDCVDGACQCREGYRQTGDNCYRANEELVPEMDSPAVVAPEALTLKATNQEKTGIPCHDSSECPTPAYGCDQENHTCTCTDGYQLHGDECVPADEESTSSQETSDLPSPEIPAPEALTLQSLDKVNVGTPCSTDQDCPSPELVCKEDEFKCTCAKGYEVNGQYCKRASRYNPQTSEEELKPLGPKEEPPPSILYDEDLISPDGKNGDSYHQQFSNMRRTPESQFNHRTEGYPPYPPPHGPPSTAFQESHHRPFDHRYPGYNDYPPHDRYGRPQYPPFSDRRYLEMPYGREQFFEPTSHYSPEHSSDSRPRDVHGSRFHENDFDRRGHFKRDYSDVPNRPPYPPPRVDFHPDRTGFGDYGSSDHSDRHPDDDLYESKLWPLMMQKIFDLQQGYHERQSGRRDKHSSGLDDETKTADGFNILTIPASQLYPPPEGTDMFSGGYGYPCTNNDECKFTYLVCNQAEYKCDCVKGYKLENNECVKIFKYKLEEYEEQGQAESNTEENLDEEYGEKKNLESEDVESKEEKREDEEVRKENTEVKADDDEAETPLHPVPGFTSITTSGNFQYMVKHGNTCKVDSDCISGGLVCQKEDYKCDCAFGYDKAGKYCVFKYDYRQPATITPWKTDSKKGDVSKSDSSSSHYPKAPDSNYPPAKSEQHGRPSNYDHPYDRETSDFDDSPPFHPYRPSVEHRPSFTSPYSDPETYSPSGRRPQSESRPSDNRPHSGFRNEHSQYDDQKPSHTSHHNQNSQYDDQMPSHTSHRNQNSQYDDHKPSHTAHRNEDSQYGGHRPSHTGNRNEHSQYADNKPSHTAHRNEHPQYADHKPSHTAHRNEHSQYDGYRPSHMGPRNEHSRFDERGPSRTDYRTDDAPFDASRPPYSQFRPEHSPIDERRPPPSEFRPEHSPIDERRPPYSQFRPEHSPIDERRPPPSEFRPEHSPIDERRPPPSEFRPEHSPIDERRPPPSEFRPEQKPFEERPYHRQPYPEFHPDHRPFEERPSYRPPDLDRRREDPPPHSEFRPEPLPFDERPPPVYHPPHLLGHPQRDFQHSRPPPPVLEGPIHPPHHLNRVDQVNGYPVVPRHPVCHSNVDCPKPYTFCSLAESRCVCFKGFVYQGNDCVSASGPYTFEQSYTSGITYEDFCTTDIECKNPNGMCVNFQCQCRHGYTKHGRDCLAAVSSGKRDLDEPCTEHGQCAEAFSFCSGSRCQCARGYIRYGSRCVATYGYLPSECTTNKDCKVRNSECDKHRSRCKCLYGYAKYLQSCREAGHLHGQCLPDSSCYQPNLACYEAHQRCKCREGFVEDGLGCQRHTDGGLGSLCAPQPPAGYAPSDYLARCQREFVCKFGKCRCPDNFHKTGARCSAGATVLGSQCTDALDCPTGNIGCVDGWCSCRPGYFFYQRSCVLIQYHFGASCQSNAECEGPHMTCHEGRCVCQPGYTQQRYQCLPLKDSEYFQTRAVARYPRADVTSGGGETTIQRQG